jgi:hypothetical protein
MAQRRSGNSHTTISITWEDKDEFRRFAKKLKTTKNGDMHESDAVLFNRMLNFYIDTCLEQPLEKGEPTYPNKIVLGDIQPSS